MLRLEVFRPYMFDEDELVGECGIFYIIVCKIKAYEKLISYALDYFATFAASTTFVNAAASFIAMSAKIFLSSSIPALFKPWMNFE